MGELERRYQEEMTEEEMIVLLKSIISVCGGRSQGEEMDGEKGMEEESGDQKEMEFDIFLLNGPGILAKI